MILILFFFSFVFTEKRPLKFQVPNTYYRNPTSRLLQRDFFDTRHHHQQQRAHLYHQEDVGSIVGENEALLYTFGPTKQLVSIFLISFLYLLIKMLTKDIYLVSFFSNLFYSNPFLQHISQELYLSFSQTNLILKTWKTKKCG